MNDLLHVTLSNAVAAMALAVVAAVTSRLCRRPALTHGLWLLVLLKLVTPPLLTIRIPWVDVAPPSGPDVSSTRAADASLPAPVPQAELEVTVVGPAEDAEGAAGEPVPEVAPLAPPTTTSEAPTHPTPGDRPPERSAWMVAGVVLWLAGTVAWTVLVLVRTGRFRRLLRFAEPAPAWLRDEVGALASRLGLRRVPSVWLVPGRLAPMLWSLGGAPRLLVPDELLDGLTAQQRATLLLHELAHLHRRDHWVRLLEMLATGLYWWHPVVWWARRELREAEEQCCDAWVVWALPGAGRIYATALLECLDFLSEAPRLLPLGASGLGQTDDLKRRLTMIMRGMTPRRLSWGGGLVLAGLALILLPMVPTFAQDEKPRDPRQNRLDDRRDRRDEKPASKEEIDRARDEVAKLKQHLMEQLQRVREAEERLRDAAARLGRLEGKHVERRDIRIIIGGGDGPKGWRFERGAGGGRDDKGRPTPQPRTAGQPGHPPGPQSVPPGHRPVPGARPPGPGERPPVHDDVLRPTGDSDRRLRDLERRLDEVMRQLEMMRRNMQGPRDDRRPDDRRPEGGTRERRSVGPEKDTRPEGGTRERRPDAPPGVERDPKRDPNLERRERPRTETDPPRPERK
ncbi:MAG: hypothetical protein HYS12_12050 [Planctomycetes bacterium]|nr:hypothetical protein [Planctomycetota bacterium]